MDAFTLALSYGIYNISFKKAFITSSIVGLFHFFMPLLGNIIGKSIFEYTIIKPRYVLFIVFLILSIDMFLHFLEKERKIRKLTVFGMLFFAISVSFDSFSVGIGINYLFNNILLVVTTFCLISFIFTLFGFILGKKISSFAEKYSFLLGGSILLSYSILMLTK